MEVAAEEEEGAVEEVHPTAGTQLDSNQSDSLEPVHRSWNVSVRLIGSSSMTGTTTAAPLLDHPTDLKTGTPVKKPMVLLSDDQDHDGMTITTALHHLEVRQ